MQYIYIQHFHNSRLMTFNIIIYNCYLITDLCSGSVVRSFASTVSTGFWNVTSTTTSSLVPIPILRFSGKSLDLKCINVFTWLYSYLHTFYSMICSHHRKTLYIANFDTYIYNHNSFTKVRNIGN